MVTFGGTVTLTMDPSGDVTIGNSSSPIKTVSSGSNLNPGLSMNTSSISPEISVPIPTVPIPVVLTQ